MKDKNNPIKAALRAINWTRKRQTLNHNKWKVPREEEEEEEEEVSSDNNDVCQQECQQHQQKGLVVDQHDVLARLQMQPEQTVIDGMQKEKIVLQLTKLSEITFTQILQNAVMKLRNWCLEQQTELIARVEKIFLVAD